SNESILHLSLCLSFLSSSLPSSSHLSSPFVLSSRLFALALLRHVAATHTHTHTLSLSLSPVHQFSSYLSPPPQDAEMLSVSWTRASTEKWRKEGR
uniref:Uncharacterized protein n=1 Tax=Mola mola TaxID=94237 RepID=A0A3Q3X6X8_MOLML